MNEALRSQPHICTRFCTLASSSKHPWVEQEGMLWNVITLYQVAVGAAVAAAVADIIKIDFVRGVFFTLVCCIKLRPFVFYGYI